MPHKPAAASDVISKLALLAGIPNDYRDRFCCHIGRALEELTRAPATKSKIPQQLMQIERAVSRLQKKLAPYPVNVMIDCVLSATGQSSYPDCMEALERLGRAVRSCRELARRPSHRPHGIQTRFDVLVWTLFSAAKLHGGQLKIYKSGEWRGSLLDAVHLLKPILPSGLVPAAKLGDTLGRIAKLARH